MPSEKDVQNAIVEALVLDGWLVIRPNGGGMSVKNRDGSNRYVRFSYWQHLGIDQQDSGISDVIADKQVDEVLYIQDGITGEFVPYDKKVCIHLAIKCKAPGKKARCPICLGYGTYFEVVCHKCHGEKVISKKKKPTAKQQAFLDAVTEHGGIAIIADDLSDVLPYLDRVEAG